MLVRYDDGEVIVEQTKGENKVEWKELTNMVVDDGFTAQPPAEYWTPPSKCNSVSALAFAHTDHAGDGPADIFSGTGGRVL